jgi:hypothetical protein
VIDGIGLPGDEGYAFVRALRSLPPEEGGLPKPVDPGLLVAAITTLAADGRPSRPRV